MSEELTKENLLKKIEENSFYFGEISEDLKKDIDVAKALIEKNGYGSFDKIDESFKKNKELLILAYQRDTGGYNSNASNDDYVPQEFMNDVEVLCAAVKSGWSFDKVTDELKKNKQIIMASVERTPRDFEKLSEEFRNDESVLLAAFEKKESFFSPYQFASDALKSNKDVAMKVMNKNGMSLEYVSDDLKKDREVVLVAVQNRGHSLQYADESFRKDREIALFAAKDGASNYIDASFKTDEEICLTLIKKSERDIFWCDESLKKDKAFMIKAIQANKYLTLEHTSLNEEPEIKDLIQQGKAITKLYCEELFGVLKKLVPDVEYLCFAWSGGGDSFGGYRLKAVKYPDQDVNATPLEEQLTNTIQEIMDYSGVIEELDLNIGWVGSFTCQGGLVIALKPLTGNFEWQIGSNAVHDEYNKVLEEPYDRTVCTISLSEGYQGLSISGEGAEEVTDWDNVEEDEDPEPQYDTNYFDRNVPFKD